MEFEDREIYFDVVECGTSERVLPPIEFSWRSHLSPKETLFQRNVSGNLFS
jgi:hypothetical protein